MYYRKEIRICAECSSNLAAGLGSIRPLLTSAAVTADIEVLISFLPWKVYAGITDFMSPPH